MKSIYLVVLSLLLISCSDEQKTDNDSVKKQNINEHSASLINIDERGLDSLIKNRDGKILFINVWATWCLPCVEEFPAVVKVYETYKTSPIDFVSLNVDFSSDPQNEIVPFLKQQHTNFTVYTVMEKQSEKVINLINPEWSGAIPVTVIYDAKGIRKHFISGADNFQSFKNKIDSLSL